MQSIYTNNGKENLHSEDMQDIITTVPSWLLRWGITLFFGILVLMLFLAAFIHYPDIVNASLRIDSPNPANLVVSKVSGKMVKLMVTADETVSIGQPLAYFESKADHEKVLMLLQKLNQIKRQVLQVKPLNSLLLQQAENTDFGELQASYQIYVRSYIEYLPAINNGFLNKKKKYLLKAESYLKSQKLLLNTQESIEKRDFGLAIDEYEVHKKPTQQKVENTAKLRQEESIFLAKKAALIKTGLAIITTNNDYESKQKEMLELDKEAIEGKGKFLQNLNSFISIVEDWKSKYVLSAPASGKLSYVGIIHENQMFAPDQEIFYISPSNQEFYGQMFIPQNNIGKVKLGQQVLIKFKSYPYEEFGMIGGKISYISDFLNKDDVFISKVDFETKSTTSRERPINLKQGMIADAEIITQDASVLQRLSWGFYKIFKNR